MKSMFTLLYCKIEEHCITFELYQHIVNTMKNLLTTLIDRINIGAPSVNFKMKIVLHHK